MSHTEVISKSDITQVSLVGENKNQVWIAVKDKDYYCPYSDDEIIKALYTIRNNKVWMGEWETPTVVNEIWMPYEEFKAQFYPTDKQLMIFVMQNKDKWLC